MAKRALITGITGQDGSYLAEELLNRGYEVHGIVRRSSSFNTQRIEHLYADPHLHPDRPVVHLHYGDLLDPSSIRQVLQDTAPDEVYHLAAQSHVRVSFDMPEYTAHTIVLGTTTLLEAIHRSGARPRFYQAGSSEMFGRAPAPQDEATLFAPQSPYAAAKVGAHAMVRVYRQAYGLFAVNGILFNHESPRRGPTFVTRKITRGVARIVAGLDDALYLGNLDAKRDWGYAPEYMEAVWLMLQQPDPDDYVVATGESHTVREFLEEVCNLAGISPEAYVRFDPRYLRPAEVDELRGDAAKARSRLGWAPRTTFHDLVRIMLEADLREVGLDPAQVMRGGPAAAQGAPRSP